jgi:hypothetical protein
MGENLSRNVSQQSFYKKKFLVVSDFNTNSNNQDAETIKRSSMWLHPFTKIHFNAALLHARVSEMLFC